MPYVPKWRGNDLWSSRKRMVSIERDGTYPDMWRIRWPDGSLSDMVNRTRAKDAAYNFVLSVLSGSVGSRRGALVR